MKESKFKNGYCQKCLIRERQNVFIKNDLPVPLLPINTITLSLFIFVISNFFNSNFIIKINLYFIYY